MSISTVLGPVPHDSPLYVERAADNSALRHVRRGDYIKLIEPRQQGKTSLLLRLCHRFADHTAVTAYISLADIVQSSQAEWFAELEHRIQRQIAPATELSDLATGHGSKSWRPFLENLIHSTTGQVLIAFDEVSSIPLDWASIFYSTIREVYNRRFLEKDLQRLTFAFAGSVHPDGFIPDNNISPFNVAIDVRIDDFTVEQIRMLLERQSLPAASALTIAERVFYWTSGQPYMTQWLCSCALERSADTAEIDECVTDFIRTDTNHLPRIARRLHDNGADVPLASFQRLVNGAVKFNPVLDPHHFHLERIFGLVKGDDRKCQIRCRVYLRAFGSLLFADNGVPLDSLPLDLGELRAALRAARQDFAPDDQSSTQNPDIEPPKAWSILAAFAAPVNEARTHWEREARTIHTMIERNPTHFRVKEVHGCTPDKLHHELLHLRPNFLHFQGHGSVEGLLFEDVNGDKIRVNWAGLTSLLQAATSLRCVILNACHSITLAKLHPRHFFLVTTPGETSIESTLNFTAGFYDALAANQTIETSYHAGCNRMRLYGSSDAELPHLSEPHT